MNTPFFTIDDVYLLLKPFSFSYMTLIWIAFVCITLIVFHRTFSKNLNNLVYVFLGILIVINSAYFFTFLRLMPFEALRFAGKDIHQTSEILEGEDFKLFLKLLESEIRTNQKYYFYNPADPYYKNVRVKCRLIYYLAPRRIAEYPEDADYVVIVNYDKPLPDRIKIPENKHGHLMEHSENLMLIKLINNDKKGQNK